MDPAECFATATAARIWHLLPRTGLTVLDFALLVPPLRVLLYSDYGGHSHTRLLLNTF